MNFKENSTSAHEALEVDCCWQRTAVSCSLGVSKYSNRVGEKGIMYTKFASVTVEKKDSKVFLQLNLQNVIN